MSADNERCHGRKGDGSQCTRTGEPQDGAYWCRDHAAQRLTDDEREQLMAMARAAAARSDAERAIRSVEHAQSLTDEELKEYLDAMNSPKASTRLVARSRFEQGLPLRIQDPAVIARIAQIIQVSERTR